MIFWTTQRLGGLNKAAYKIFGRSTAVFASNFLMARSSRMMAATGIPALSQVFSTISYNLVYGELAQARKYGKQQNLEELIESYIAKSYYKTASLISLACRGVGLIHGLEESKQRKLFNFGAHFGIAFQVADDVLDFTSSSEELGKPAFNDLVSGVITAPTLFAYAENKSAKMNEMIQRGFKEENDVEETLKIIEQTAGISNSEKLALMHVKDSIESIASLSEVDTE